MRRGDALVCVEAFILGEEAEKMPQPKVEEGAACLCVVGGRGVAERQAKNKGFVFREGKGSPWGLWELALPALWPPASVSRAACLAPFLGLRSLLPQ